MELTIHEQKQLEKLLAKRDAPEPRVPFSTTLTSHFGVKLSRKAKAIGVSVHDLIADVLVQYLQDHSV